MSFPKATNLIVGLLLGLLAASMAAAAVHWTLALLLGLNISFVTTRILMWINP